MFRHTPDHVYSIDELAEKLRQVSEELIYCRTAADTAGYTEVGEAIGRAADPLADAQTYLSMQEQ
jgi:peroxiredoxin family protein